MNNKKIKSVSLNENNPLDKSILKHVKRKNFSGYVKKLILKDMEEKARAKAQEAPQVEPQPVIEQEPQPLPVREKEKPAERFERLREQMPKPTYSQPALYHNQPKRHR